MKTKRTSGGEEDWGFDDDDENIELQSNGSSAFGQVIVLIMVGFILLLLTNTIQLQGDMSAPPAGGISETKQSGDIIATTSHRPVGLTTRKRIPQNEVVKESPHKSYEERAETVQNSANADKDGASTSKAVSISNVESVGETDASSTGDLRVGDVEVSREAENDPTDNYDGAIEPAVNDTLEPNARMETLGPLPNISIQDARLTDFVRLREDEH